jgi:hypothetical protein
MMNRYRLRKGISFQSPIILLAVVMMIVFGCSNGGGGSNGGDGEADTSGGDGGGAVTSVDYVVLAWNDLGMHCLNPTYDTLIILPPYNTLWAQVIERGNPPRIATSGISVSYAVIGDTTSLNKLSYDQFWNPSVLALFPIEAPSPDFGLNLRDPGVHNGLSGDMQLVNDHCQAEQYQNASVTIAIHTLVAAAG